MEGTPISGIQTELEIFDTYSSCIYIKQGWLIIADIDIRHPNNDLITIALRGSKEGDELSMATDKFLLDFATHLRDLFPEKEHKVLLETPEMIAIEAAKPEIQETNGESEKVLSKKTRALIRLAVLWVKHTQGRISHSENMRWFLDERAPDVGLKYVAENEFKKFCRRQNKPAL